MNELQQQIQHLQQQLDALRNAAGIPFAVEQAFRVRLADLTPKISTKSATSENRAVNEAGGSSYSVLGIPDGFVEVTVDNVVYYLPFYTS